MDTVEGKCKNTVCKCTQTHSKGEVNICSEQVPVDLTTVVLLCSERPAWVGPAADNSHTPTHTHGLLSDMKLPGGAVCESANVQVGCCRHLSGVSPTSPLVEPLDNVRMSPCENTAGGYGFPKHHYSWVLAVCLHQWCCCCSLWLDQYISSAIVIDDVSRSSEVESTFISKYKWKVIFKST